MPSLISAPHEARSLLAGTRLFGGLDERALDELVQRVEWLHVAWGETLFRLGDPGDAVYLVATGRLQAILEEGSGAVRVLREVGRGDNVGEMSLIIAEPRSATVRAVRDTEVARLSRADFAHVLEAHPPARLRLIESLTEWLHRMTHPRPSTSIPTTIAVIPIEPGAPAAEIAAALVNGLEGAGSAMHLTSLTVDRELGRGCADAERGSAEYARTSAWLDALEGSHRFVVYEAAPAVSSWSKRCVRQADRTGRAIGLVLSGGGARGFAHIGVIRALEEAGIPIDRIGGTSMGAVIGAQLA